MSTAQFSNGAGNEAMEGTEEEDGGCWFFF